MWSFTYFTLHWMLVTRYRIYSPYKMYFTWLFNALLMIYLWFVFVFLPWVNWFCDHLALQIVFMLFKWGNYSFWYIRCFSSLDFNHISEEKFSSRIVEQNHQTMFFSIIYFCFCHLSVWLMFKCADLQNSQCAWTVLLSNHENRVCIYVYIKCCMRVNIYWCCIKIND